MAKHVLDRPRRTAPVSVKTFMNTDRHDGLHPASRALIKRERPDMQARIRRFIQIARAGEGSA